MIIEAINRNELKGKVYEVGAQKNVTDSYGQFLVEKNQNWKYVRGATNTALEQRFFDAMVAKDSEEKEEPKKASKSQKKK